MIGTLTSRSIKTDCQIGFSIGSWRLCRGSSTQRTVKQWRFSHFFMCSFPFQNFFKKNNWMFLNYDTYLLLASVQLEEYFSERLDWILSIPHPSNVDHAKTSALRAKKWACCHARACKNFLINSIGIESVFHWSDSILFGDVLSHRFFLLSFALSHANLHPSTPKEQSVFPSSEKFSVGYFVVIYR